MPTAPKWVFDTLDFFMSKLPSVEVVRTEYLSSSVKVIKLRGLFNELSASVGAFFDIRINDTEARRYTISSIDRENNTLDLIVYLNDSGLGSRYMDTLEKGDEVYLNKPRNDQKYYDSSVESVLFFGDETSLALACSFLPMLEKNKQNFQFVFELDESNMEVPRLLGLKDSIVYRKGDVFRREQRIAELDLFKNRSSVWAYCVLTGNVKSVQAFRKAVKMKTRSKVKAHGFWLEGKKGL